MDKYSYMVKYLLKRYVLSIDLTLFKVSALRTYIAWKGAVTMDVLSP